MDPTISFYKLGAVVDNTGAVYGQFANFFYGSR